MSITRHSIFSNSSIAEGDTFLSNDSLITRIYAKAGVLTVFMKDNFMRDFFVNIDSNIPFSSRCFNTTYGQREHAGHNTWHIDASDKTHYHFLKSDQKGWLVPITPQEVECFVEAVKLEEKIHHICKDGKTDCFIADADAERLLPSFSNIPNNDQSPPSNAFLAFKSPSATFAKNLLFSATKAYYITFANTFIDCYVIPKLINKGYLSSDLKQFCSKAFLQTVAALLVAPSITQLTINAAISHFFKPALIHFGGSKDVINEFAALFGTLTCVYNGLATLPSYSITNNLAREHALALIRKLPKLKQEDTPEPYIEGPRIETMRKRR